MKREDMERMWGMWADDVSEVGGRVRRKKVRLVKKVRNATR